MKRSFIRGPWGKVAGFLAAVAAFALLVYLNWGLPTPREQDRIAPRDAAFSLIHPPGWTTQSSYLPPSSSYACTLEMFPAKAVGMPDRVTARQFRTAPDVQKLQSAGFVKGQFQNQPAWTYAGRLKRSEYVWQAVFERSGTWFELVMTTMHDQDIPTSELFKYLETFRTTTNTAPATQSGAPIEKPER